MDNIKIGYNIKKQRKWNKMTQQELGNRIGKTESTIRKYENGTIEVPLSVLDDIAEVFEINPLSLLEYDYYENHIENKDDSIELFFNMLGIDLQKIDATSGNYDYDGYSKITYKGKSYIVATMEIYRRLFEDIKDYASFRIEKVLEDERIHYPNYFRTDISQIEGE